MTDEKALKILKSIEILAFRDKTKKYFMKDVCEAQKVAIKALDQQPKMGKWIDYGQYAEGHNEHAYRCSECDEHYIGYVGEFKYCPNCGAKMEAEE